MLRRKKNRRDPSPVQEGACPRYGAVVAMSDWWASRRVVSVMETFSGEAVRMRILRAVAGS